MSEEGSTDTRQHALTRLAGAMRALADWRTPLDTSGDAMFGPGVEVVCRADAHAGTPVHVQWLFPDALPGVNADALLVEDDPLDTLKAAMLRSRAGDAVRARYRLECPVCGDRGTVVTSADPYGPAGVLTRARQALSAGVSQLDLYGLQRYISD